MHVQNNTQRRKPWALKGQRNFTLRCVYSAKALIAKRSDHTGYSFLGSLGEEYTNWVKANQGDQIGRFFASWATFGGSL